MRVSGRLCVAIALLAGMAALSAAPAAAQPTTWSTRPSASPAGPPVGDLRGVACPTPSMCFAVGGPMVEQWTGTQWAIVNDVVGAGSNLNGITCPSATMCIAVGDTTTHGVTTALTEIWNGSSWSTVASPAGVARLNEIACTSTTHCFALESYLADLVEWNGTAWSTPTTPALPPSSGFFNLTCASTTWCFVVGAKYVSGNNLTLVEQWNGTTWTIATTPTPSGTGAYFNDVSCPTAMMCVAVGESQSVSTGKAHTFAAHWNGTSWSVVTTPTPSSTSVSPNLVGVSCSSTSDCFAISDMNLIEHWNGTGWAGVASPAHGALVDELSDVVCLSASSCSGVGMAVPTSAASTLPPQAAAEQWDGTSWKVQGVSQHQPAQSTLSAVACKLTVCFAVGQYTEPGGKTAPLIERSSAAGWKIVAGPRRAGTESMLSGVACPTTTACFAVGRTLNGKTLAMVWRGKSWAIVKSANKASWPSRLTNIACVSARDCWAVGRYDGNLLGTLVEHWNGTAWTIVPSPSRKPSPQFSTPGINDLQGISCVTTRFCIAVGSDSGYLYNSQETLVEQWNGSEWALVKSVNANTGKYSNLASVSCTSTKSCWAVGNWFAKIGSVTQHPFIEHWNGSAWSRAASPDPAGITHNQLLGVACPSKTQCVAVGGGSDSTRISGKSFSEVLSGSTWHLATTVNPAAADISSLNGVACANASQCNAVGGFTRPSTGGTLAERFS